MYCFWYICSNSDVPISVYLLKLKYTNVSTSAPRQIDQNWYFCSNSSRPIFSIAIGWTLADHASDKSVDMDWGHADRSDATARLFSIKWPHAPDHRHMCNSVSSIDHASDSYLASLPIHVDGRELYSNITIMHKFCLLNNFSSLKNWSVSTWNLADNTTAVDIQDSVKTPNFTALSHVG